MEWYECAAVCMYCLCVLHFDVWYLLRCVCCGIVWALQCVLCCSACIVFWCVVFGVVWCELRQRRISLLDMVVPLGLNAFLFECPASPSCFFSPIFSSLLLALVSAPLWPGSCLCFHFLVAMAQTGWGKKKEYSVFSRLQGNFSLWMLILLSYWLYIWEKGQTFQKLFWVMGPIQARWDLVIH